MCQIKQLFAIEILDSRGNPTIEVELHLDTGEIGTAMVPSGASTGKKEALELRDKDPARYLGKGVLKAISNINQNIAKKIKDSQFSSQKQLDQRLIAIDGTINKSNLGANAILGVSLAFARAMAKKESLELYNYLHKTYRLNDKFHLPLPMINIINGGVHADNKLDFQEFMIVPTGFDTFACAITASCEVFHTLKYLLKEKGMNTSVGDEGGFAPNLQSNEEALILLLSAIEKSGYHHGDHFKLALDVASSEFYSDKGYHLVSENRFLSSEKLIEYYERLILSYPIISIEDGMSEDDEKGWQLLTEKFHNKIQLVGDDLFVTNPDIFMQGIKKGWANAILLKVNQIGTLTETIAAIDLANVAGYRTVTSHRSGETEDTFIADLAVGLDTQQIKTGSMSRSERTAKYNRLLKIESKLGKQGCYVGKKLFQNKFMSSS